MDLFSDANDSSATADPNQVLMDLKTLWVARPHNTGGPPGHSAMPPRLRKRDAWRQAPLPCLKYCCKMCEAEFPTSQTLSRPLSLIHGGARWAAFECRGNERPVARYGSHPACRTVQSRAPDLCRIKARRYRTPFRAALKLKDKKRAPAPADALLLRNFPPSCAERRGFSIRLR